ncbi:hypothetical protein Mal15_05770 [Stieleria maiorica]|uniref:Uncharacterized protein n=1 Tax=Stieleria maiorica TaxID=2795974 RepID=A0A5B9M750_9BACT|nr:hypothetical protein Mal15_05770 [Stieleria maiorica]
MQPEWTRRLVHYRKTELRRSPCSPNSERTRKSETSPRADLGEGGDGPPHAKIKLRHTIGAAFPCDLRVHGWVTLARRVRPFYR